MSIPITIITRSSKLAMWQANFIADQLRHAGATVTINPIETKGDKVLSTTLSKIGSKGVFTAELETALLKGTADIAVHSAKDMPSELPMGLEIIAFSEREKVHDVLISNKQHLSIEQSITIGTASTRRVGLLKHYFPNCSIVPVRGNLQTRFKKMEEGACDGLLLAYAGVHRMDMAKYIIHEFDTDHFTPQTGQGAIAIEVSSNLAKAKKELITTVCNNKKSQIEIECERAFLYTMQGGCSVPVFAYAKEEKGIISLNAGIIGLHGEKRIQHVFEDKSINHLSLGQYAAEVILAKGGKELLKTIKKELSK
ncbi:MAG: hydroxymethylbilane synthase [Cyclobacteriaceae bacterium]